MIESLFGGTTRTRSRPWISTATVDEQFAAGQEANVVALEAKAGLPPRRARPTSSLGSSAPGARLLDDKGRDAGLRFVDLDEDGHLDVVFSNDQEYGDLPLRVEGEGLDAEGHAGRQGRRARRDCRKIVRRTAPTTASSSTRATSGGRTKTRPSCPNLVDRRSFNDLLKNVEPRGKSPAAALKSIRVAPGFTVEQVATEPLVKDPIAFEWGADGKLWVVEMGDYPLGVDGKGKPGGVVRYPGRHQWRRPV